MSLVRCTKMMDEGQFLPRREGSKARLAFSQGSPPGLPQSPFTNSRARQTHLVPLDVSNVTCEGSVSPDLHRQVLQRQREDGRRAAAARADDHIGRG